MFTARHSWGIALLALVVPLWARADVTISIDPSKRLGPASRYLTAACIEDVNHEIYGGLYSQMIFGESFQEPATPQPVRGFAAWGGDWTVRDGVLAGSAGEGPKLIRAGTVGASDTVGVDVLLQGATGGNAGLIVGVHRPGMGADQFDGYEVTLDATAKAVRVGRHQHNYRLVSDTPCEDVTSDKWISLAVSRHGRMADVLVDGKSIVQFRADDLPPGSLGLRQWQRPAQYRNLWISSGGNKTPVPFEPVPSSASAVVSAMWTPVRRGTAVGAADLETVEPFVGAQSQRLAFTSGTGAFGIANEGLNHQGIGILAERAYRGHLWARAQTPAKASVSLASTDGTHTYASSDLTIADTAWHRYDFELTPNITDRAARFEFRLTAPGSAVLGYVFLEPGPWGTFAGLPVRRDVAQAMIDQGLTALRYGGSMVNNAEYRWKTMIGPRDRRRPYHGHWYLQSTNGWGIFDFLNFAEAARMLPVPDFSIDESPRDMVDFIEYANGPADSTWGAKRVADGHPAPYGLTHLELGNEERVDAGYADKFEGIASAIWAKDPSIVLTVGDFAYHRPITDPMHVRGGSVRDLSAHQRIMAIAKRFGAKVWFDVHVWTEQPPASDDLIALPTYIDAIDKLADGAKHHVVVFELNANNHQHRRAISNAQAMIRAERDGRLPFVSSANGLQVDGQNDNGWDQGLVFLNSETAWLQPPGYVTQMVSRNYLPVRVESTVAGDEGHLEAAATTSEDGHTVVLKIVNVGATPITASVRIVNRPDIGAAPVVEVLAADLAAENTAQRPDAVHPSTPPSTAGADGGHQTFPPYSLTVLRWGPPSAGGR